MQPLPTAVRLQQVEPLVTEYTQILTVAPLLSSTVTRLRQVGSMVMGCIQKVRQVVA